ncbi:glycosyltransferase family 2 protein, partial [Paenibacillus alginolyticus]
MDIFLWTVAVALLLQLLFVIWNLAQLPSLGGNGRGRAWLDREGMSIGGLVQAEGAVRQAEGKEAKELKPRLSVLIPARDEAMNIAACLRSVLVEPSPHLEVLVLDDRSTDGTAEAAILAAAGDPRVRVLP